MREAYWTFCTHCRRKQRTQAKIGSSRKCVFESCGRSFKIKRIAPPPTFTGRYV